MDDSGMINFYVKVNVDGYCAESEHLVESRIDKDTLIENLGFSERTYKIFLEAGAKTFNDVLTIISSEPMKFRNLGRKSLEEVLKILQECGLREDEEEEDNQNKEKSKEVDRLGTLLEELDIPKYALRPLRKSGIDIVKELCCLSEKEFNDIVSEQTKLNPIILKHMRINELTFRPEGVDSFLYLYPNQIKQIAAEKDNYWEYRLFIEVAILNYEWLRAYRDKEVVLWQTNSGIYDIGEKLELYILVHEKLKEILEFTENIAKCINEDVVNSFGAIGEAGDEYAIVHAAEKLMNLYKNVIRCRREFRTVEAEEQYKPVIDSLCGLYEDFCKKNIDVFYQKLLLAKKTLKDIRRGAVSEIDAHIDLRMPFDMDTSLFNSALKDLEKKFGDSSDMYKESLIYMDEAFSIKNLANSKLYITFCGLRLNSVKRTIIFKFRVENYNDQERHFWIKNVILDGKGIENLSFIGCVDGMDKKYMECCVSAGGERKFFTTILSKQSLSFCVEVDDENDNEISNSQIVDCLIDFQSSKFYVVGLEEYEEKDRMDILDDEI